MHSQLHTMEGLEPPSTRAAHLRRPLPHRWRIAGSAGPCRLHEGEHCKRCRDERSVVANSTGAGLTHIARTHKEARGIIIQEATVTGLQLVAQRPDHQDVIISCMCKGQGLDQGKVACRSRANFWQKPHASWRVAHVSPWSSSVYSHQAKWYPLHRSSSRSGGVD